MSTIAENIAAIRARIDATVETCRNLDTAPGEDRTRVARSLRPLARMGRGQYGVSLPLRNINGF